MKMKIFLFVAVALVASSETTSEIPDGVRNFLNTDTNEPTPASNGISGFAESLEDAENQIRGVGKGKGDSLKDTLKKLNNNTYSPPDNFTSCLTGKDEEIMKNVTDLTKMAKNASDEIKKKYNDKALTEPLKNYTDTFTEVNETFWTPLKNLDFEGALKGLQKTENDTKNAKTSVMFKLYNENNTDSWGAASNLLNGVNQKWHEIKIGINTTIIECLMLGSTETSEN